MFGEKFFAEVMAELEKNADPEIVIPIVRYYYISVLGFLWLRNQTHQVQDYARKNVSRFVTKLRACTARVKMATAPTTDSLKENEPRNSVQVCSEPGYMKNWTLDVMDAMVVRFWCWSFDNPYLLFKRVPFQQTSAGKRTT